MNDIVTQNQNQANLKVGKDELNDYQKQNNIQQQSPSNQQSSNQSLQSLNTKNSDGSNPIQEIPPIQENSSVNPNTNQPVQPSSNIQKPTQTKQPQIDIVKGLPNPKSLASMIIKYIMIVIIVFVLGYVLVNWPAISLKYNYWNTVRQEESWEKLHPIELLDAKNTAQELDEDYLYIKSLGIQAPVVWGVEDSDVKGMSSQGLVNYTGGVLPDDAQGQIYISGQTSDPIWSSSIYKTAFTLLDKIKTNANILVVYKNKIYVYQVTQTTKKLGDVEIIPGTNTNPQLNLIAKYPIGIGWSMFVVEANLVDIKDNVPASIDEKIKEDYEYSNELNPIKITPAPTNTTYQVGDEVQDDSTAPQVFLPNL